MSLLPVPQAEIEDDGIQQDLESIATTPTPHKGTLSAFTRPGRSLGLVLDGIPLSVSHIEYAVRGPIAQRSVELDGDLTCKPFDKIVACHIGNPQALSMKPLSYIREILALVCNPCLLDAGDSLLTKQFKADSVERAKMILSWMKSSGAYTESLGDHNLRRIVAEWFERRDGFVANVNSIMLTAGASDAVETIMNCLISGSTDGVMIPLPQYPLYSALLTKFGGTAIPYELDEEKGWSIDEAELSKKFDQALDVGIDVRALVVITPGNPAPTLLDRSEILSLLRFAEKRRILVIADEVYQDNCYNPERPFVPFRKVLLEEKLTTQIASLHSASKGFYGECGYRGGVCQLENVDADVLSIIYKLRSIRLCSNTIGQIAMALVCSPPQRGDPSYEQYIQEKSKTLADLKLRAEFLTKFFNELTGVSCQAIDGALYAFPNMRFSEKAINEASRKGQSVEEFYCLELLEATGIVTTNGDGFGQKAGSHHIRLAMCPTLDELVECMKSYKTFHESFFKRYGLASTNH